jgi:hypothetical protein
VNSTPRRRVAVALAAAVAGVFAAAPAGGMGERLGIYFDEDATQCAAPLDPFVRRHCWIYGFFPPDSLVSGVLFRLVLPVGVEPESLRTPRNLFGSEKGTITEGLDLRFNLCVPGRERVLLAELNLIDQTFGGPRPDLRIEVQGAASADSIKGREPRLRICDPADPLGVGRGFIDVTGVDGTFNCTTECPCITAVLTRAWSAVKRLYRER